MVGKKQADIKWTGKDDNKGENLAMGICFQSSYRNQHPS
jgi:hypothetical protein